MPDIDAGALARRAGGAVDDTQIDPQRDARPALGDLRADKSGIEIIRPLDRLRRQETDVAKRAGVGERSCACRADQGIRRGYRKSRKRCAA